MLPGRFLQVKRKSQISWPENRQVMVRGPALSRRGPKKQGAFPDGTDFKRNQLHGREPCGSKNRLVEALGNGEKPTDLWPASVSTWMLTPPQEPGLCPAHENTARMPRREPWGFLTLDAILHLYLENRECPNIVLSHQICVHCYTTTTTTKKP